MARSDTQFKPGKSGNPAGRPGLPPEVREKKKLNRANFEAAVELFSGMTKAEAETYIKSGEASLLEMSVYAQFAASMKGKTQPLAFLCDRKIGPVAQIHKVKVDDTLSKELGDMTEEDKDALAAQVAERLKGAP